MANSGNSRVSNERTPLLNQSKNYNTSRREDAENITTANQAATPVTIKNSKKCKWICIAVTIAVLMGVGAIVTIILVSEDNYPHYNYNDNYNYQYVEEATTQSPQIKEKTIFVYNPTKSYSRWNENSRLIPDLTSDYYCGNNCVITDNWNRKNLRIDEFDAILFDGSTYYGNSHKRNKKQLYVYAYDGYANYSTMERYWRNDFFNVTMTYRLDSDIIWQNYRMGNKNDGYAPMKQVFWKHSKLPTADAFNVVKQMKNYRGNLTAFVEIKETPLWSKKRQLDIIEEMQKAIDIDIFGDGFKPMFDKQSYQYKKYHYYLTFDSESCSDYIDDNIYESLKNSVIPVTLNRKDYKRFIAPGSYISKADFETFTSLAEYMARIKWSIHYAKYLAWRIDYDVDETPSVICDFCKRLEYHYYYGTEQQVKNWWDRIDC